MVIGLGFILTLSLAQASDDFPNKHLVRFVKDFNSSKTIGEALHKFKSDLPVSEYTAMVGKLKGYERVKPPHLKFSNPRTLLLMTTELITTLKLKDIRNGHYILNQKELDLSRDVAFETSWQKIIAALPNSEPVSGLSLFPRAHARSLFENSQGAPVVALTTAIRTFSGTANEVVSCMNLDAELATCHNYREGLTPKPPKKRSFPFNLFPASTGCEVIDDSIPCTMPNAEYFLNTTRKTLPETCTTRSSATKKELSECLEALEIKMRLAGWSPHPDKNSNAER